MKFDMHKKEWEGLYENGAGKSHSKLKLWTYFWGHSECEWPLIIEHARALVTDKRICILPLCLSNGVTKQIISYSFYMYYSNTILLLHFIPEYNFATRSVTQT